MSELSAVLRQEDTVLFVGSGISQWAGLPSWSMLIEELARFVEAAGADGHLVLAEAEQGDLLQAASYGFDKLTKHQIGEFIRRACRFGVAEPHEIHRLVVTLGPRCFVTTNYDDLLEQSLRRWQPQRFVRPPVTNRHLTELAEIFHSRSQDFIFKPHGDAGDSESIILTREQYRQLLPDGERHSALEALKTLMATRPVVYLGFGLRDPDFIYLRDLLANTYKGGIRDHYALMPDVSSGETEYWRRHYGIHLLGYETKRMPGRPRDHSQLLEILNDLASRADKPRTSSSWIGTSDFVLALARYAAGVARAPKVDPEFTIRVRSARETGRDRLRFRKDKFALWPVTDFLVDGPVTALLLGLPGAGKSYSIRQAAAQLAERLHASCLEEPFDHNQITIPIVADLKFYQGDLEKLINQNLPRNLPFDLLKCHFRLKVYLDSFNEIPQEWREGVAFSSDLASLMRTMDSSGLVVASRTRDGLDTLDLPKYSLAEVDREVVLAELEMLDVDIDGRFDRELLYLFQRPFYFRHLLKESVSLPRAPSPVDVFRSMVTDLQVGFNNRFGPILDIQRALALSAYTALDRGEEAFPLLELLKSLRAMAAKEDEGDPGASEIANWLVSRSFLIPYTGGRVAFVHQSITEFLAATELARRYEDNPDVLGKKLRLRRWDQALFLTLSLLPEAKAERFLRSIIQSDFVLALDAVRYSPTDLANVVSMLLQEIPTQLKLVGSFSSQGHEIVWALESRVPISTQHEPELRTLVKMGNRVGGAASIRLAELRGVAVKDELLQLLFERKGDFNLCANGVAVAVRPFITPEDLGKIVQWIDLIESESDDLPGAEDSVGFREGVAVLLAALDLQVVRQALVPSDDLSKVPQMRGAILCEVARRKHTTAALELVGDLLLGGVEDATFSIHFMSRGSRTRGSLSWESFTSEHVGFLVDDLAARKEATAESWALHALKSLCTARPELTGAVSEQAFDHYGILKASLLYCSNPDNLNLVFEAMSELIDMPEEQRVDQPVHLLGQIDFDWVGRERLFVDLMRIGDQRLAKALLGSGCPPDLGNLGELEIGSIRWWLSWVAEASHSHEGLFFSHQLGSVLAEHATSEARAALLAEFDDPESEFRLVLLSHLLPRLTDLTTDDLGEDAISFALSTLRKVDAASSWDGHLLGKIATERFVTERLLPLFEDAKGLFLKNLRFILEEAGKRHGRRYLWDWQPS